MRIEVNIHHCNASVRQLLSHILSHLHDINHSNLWCGYTCKHRNESPWILLKEQNDGNKSTNCLYGILKEDNLEGVFNASHEVDLSWSTTASQPCPSMLVKFSLMRATNWIWKPILLCICHMRMQWEPSSQQGQITHPDRTTPLMRICPPISIHTLHKLNGSLCPILPF